MPYRMKNRFLILGLTGPLGSGCTDTAKFLSGKNIKNITIQKVLKSQIDSKEQLINKIPAIYKEIESLKSLITNRQDKNLGPYKRKFLDPNKDPVLMKNERSAKEKHEKLKIYLNRREILNVLEDLHNDKSLQYTNINENDKKIFGFMPFIYVSFTVVIIKMAIEVFYSKDGKNNFNNYFSNKIKQCKSGNKSSVMKSLKKLIEESFYIDSKEIKSFMKSIVFIKDRGYSINAKILFSSDNIELQKKYNELIRKVTTNLYEYLLKIQEILKKIKRDTQEQNEDYVFAFSEVLQDWGDNCRETGNPFQNSKDGITFNPENLYSLSTEINSIIKFLRFRIRYLDENYIPFPNVKDRENTPTLFVIECFRNPYEIEFFRSRYAEFYLMSIFAPQSIRRGRIKYFSVERDERDQGESKNTSELNKLDVTSCVLLSDITVRNDKKGKYSQRRFFEKALRYLAIIRSPGCITPTDDELYMHLAYSNSLKSNCISRKVGAIIIGPEGYISGAGWNDVGEGQIGCGLRTKSDYLTIDSIPQVSSIKDKENFHDLIKSNQGEYVCYKDLMSKMHINKKLNKKMIKENCDENCIEKIKLGLGIKRLEFCRALHAEENALLQTAKVGGMPLKGGTIYTTTYPCELCAKKLYQTGIRTICYTEPYPESISEEVFLKDGNRSIEMIPFEGVNSHSYFKLFKPIYDKKEMSYIELAKNISK